MATDWPLPGIDLADFVMVGGFASAPATDVPTLYPVAIDGMPFKVEVNQIRRRTLDSLRAASFQGASPSEASLSTEAAWLRTQRTWRYGAGLITADSQDDGLDNPLLSQRYLDSWNMEPSKIGDGIGMIRRASSATNATGPPIICGKAVAAGTATYAIVDNGVLKIDGAGSTTCTGLTGAVKAIGSDGYTVWVACFTDSTHITLHSLTFGGTVFSAMSAGSQLVPSANSTMCLFYGNGFLLLTIGLALYQISVTGALSAVIDTISTVSTSTSAFVHQITASAAFFYFAISTASVTNLPYAIFKIGIDNLGFFGKFTAAAPNFGPSESIGPIIVEKNVIMLIGTNLGLRMGEIDSAGNITVGPLVRLTDAETSGGGAPLFGVTAFARFQDKMLASFTFGTQVERYAEGVDITTFYNNISQIQCGLIEIDLGRSTEDLVPAWWFWWRETTVNGAFTARCVVAENQLNPVVFQFDRFYTLGTANLISPCSVVTSWYTFGMDANKTFVDLEIFHDALAANDHIEVYYQIDDDPTWNLAGTSNTVNTYGMSAPILVSINTRRMRFGFVLTAGSVSQLTTPRLRRIQLRAFPTPTRTEEILLPLIVHDSIRVGEDEKIDVVLDTRDAFDFLADLAQTGRPVYYQEGDRTRLVKVDKLELQPDHWSMDAGTGQYRFYQGYIVTRLLTL